MKIFFPVLLAAIVAIKSSAQETDASFSPKTAGANLQKISALDATNYYDKEVIVTGKVAQVTIRSTITFINLDKPYPESPLAIVIFHGHSSFYGDANALKGKAIEIKGKIKNYKDRPEIVQDSTNQLTILNFTNSMMRMTAPVVPSNLPPAGQSTNLPDVM